jgi:serine/threonine protein kinase
MSYSRRLVADRYRLTSLIGKGGMGRVWLARDEVLDRDVAVKEVVLPEDMSTEDRSELYQRTMREARAAGRLSHPNVVAVYDVLQHEGRPWIVMELVRSRSLYQVIKDGGPVPPREAARIGLSVLSALRTAHRAGVHHRDVKPGNVLLAEDGRVVLTDFGLATFEGDGTVTRSGIILGSAQYISPERARDGVSGPESDLWSLGATLYAAVEGRSPFARDTPMATLTALATQPPDPPRRAGPLRQVLIGLLRKNPRQRMKAPEVERLLLKVAAGDTRGRRAGGVVASTASASVAAASMATPSVRAPSVPAPSIRAPSIPVPSTPVPSIPVPSIPVPAGSAGAASASAPAATAARALPDGPSAPVASAARPERTRPERTRPRRLGLWVAGLVAVAATAGLGTAVYLRTPTTGAPTANATTTHMSLTPTADALTDAMGVQACASQTTDRETPVRLGPGQSSALTNWTPYMDPAGFALNVPVGWGMSRIGSLVCFRDPNSLKTIAVYDQGRLAGDPVQLVANTDAWQRAASLDRFKSLGVQDMHVPEGGAMLEYTYWRGNTMMHGQNWMMRLGGRVFTVALLASDGAWPVDRDFLVAALASFRVVTPE